MKSQVTNILGFVGHLVSVTVIASQVALAVKNPPANAEDVSDAGLISGLGRSPGGGHSNPHQYSCLENPMNREAWWATVHGVARVRHDLVTRSLTLFQRDEI